MAKQPAPDPGIYADIDFDTYRSWDAVNNSSLGAILRSPAHYKAAMESQRESTEQQLFGELSHTAMLEPLSVPKRYMVMPDLTKGIDAKRPTATNEYKERVEAFEKQCDGRRAVPQDVYDKIVSMSGALATHERAGKYMHADDAEREVCIVWIDKATGLKCKARCDIFVPSQERITDYKTAQDAGDFSRSIQKWGYYRQAAFYIDGVYAILGRSFQFCFVAQEKEPPFAVRAAPMSELSIQIGRDEYRRALMKIATCRMNENWPGYSDPDCWELPAWAVPSTTLKIKGETFEL